MKNIVIVDEHIVFRDSLKFFIENENIGKVIALIDSGLRLDDVFLNFVVDLVILDISSTAVNSFDLISKILINDPKVKILMLSMSNNKMLIKEMKFLGVKGFVLISAGKNELQTAICTVLTGGTYFGNDLRH